MQALLKKEYLVNKQSIIINLIIMIIFSLALGVFGRIMSYGIFMSCYLPVSNESYESSIKSDIFINSLPVTREKIVFSKYLFSLLTGAFYLSIVFLISIYIPIFESITIKELMIGSAVVSIYLSAYYPLKFYIGQIHFAISFVGFWIIILAFIFPVINYGESFDYWGMYNAYTTYTTLQVVSISIIISCIALSVSYRYSSEIYKSKDIS